MTAQDIDTGLGSVIRYFCTSGCSKFAVNPETGEVSVGGDLDAEVETEHTLTVIAKDSGLPSMSSSSLIRIEGSFFIQFYS